MKKIALVPFSDVFNNNQIFNLKNKDLNRDNSSMPYYLLKVMLKKNNIEINTIDLYDDISEIDAVLFLKLDYKKIEFFLNSFLKDKMFYIAFEPPVVIRKNSKEGLGELGGIFKYIMTWQDDLVDNEKYFKIDFPQYFGDIKDIELDFKNRKLLTNISGNKSSSHPDELYSQRLEVIDYFENSYSEDFDFYGIGWGNSDIKYENYKGKVDSKLETYSHYKFALCFENMKNINGYITEKIFDCFKAKIIPIYWGAQNITDYIPDNCFIDYRDFMSVERLYNYISNINETEYNKYIGNIEKYLNSGIISQFNTENFYKRIFNILNILD